MKKNKLKKNDITLIKDALIVKYVGVSDKRPRPYIIMFESKNYCIGYPVTSQRNEERKHGRILIKNQRLKYKKKSYLKLRTPMIIPRYIYNQKIGTITNYEKSYVLTSIFLDKIAQNKVRKQIKKCKEIEKNHLEWTKELNLDEIKR